MNLHEYIEGIKEINQDYHWYKDYIMNINLDNITWIKLNSHELVTFLKDNYYDINKSSYVHDIDKFQPYGMTYLTFDELYGMKYILGIVKNNINKYTIVAAICYNEDYKMFSDQHEYITYFSTIETNIHFRNMGIASKLIRESYNFINHNQNILISGPSELGKKHNMIGKTIDTYRRLGFTKDIRSDLGTFDINEYHDLLLGNKTRKLHK